MGRKNMPVPRTRSSRIIYNFTYHSTPVTAHTEMEYFQLLHFSIRQQCVIHSGRKCLPRVAFLWSKMPMFQRVGLREEGKPLPLAFHNLILMIKRPCDLNLVMISSLASKCQHFKSRMPIFQPFYVMKLKTSICNTVYMYNFSDLAQTSGVQN